MQTGAEEKNRRFANAVNDLTLSHAVGADVEAKLGRWIYLELRVNRKPIIDTELR
jgi:hypothetical protein